MNSGTYFSISESNLISNLKSGCTTAGKPSTWFPAEDLVEQNTFHYIPSFRCFVLKITHLILTFRFIPTITPLIFTSGPFSIELKRNSLYTVDHLLFLTTFIHSACDQFPMFTSCIMSHTFGNKNYL